MGNYDKTDQKWFQNAETRTGWVNIASVSLRHPQSDSADIERMCGRKPGGGNGEMGKQTRMGLNGGNRGSVG